jgi:hypothetical protein
MGRGTKEAEEQYNEKVRPDGYPSLADWIAGHSGAAVYRHFDGLSSRNLLYLQGELLRLQSIQDSYDAEDYETGELDAKERARDWDTFYKAALNPNDSKAQDRMRLVKDIRSTLREYSMYRSVRPGAAFLLYGGKTSAH